MNAPEHRGRTLLLLGILHGFTHVYQVALMPLYLGLQKDLGLASVDLATALVTALLLAYFIPSYVMGVLADHFSRKQLLGWGLVINALGFIGLGLAPSYPLAMTAVIIAGLGGSFFHPAATALTAQLYPVNTGRALGLMGMGAGIGFFIGPVYAGWRATSAGWRAPVIELGVIGLVAALAFFWLAQETPAETTPSAAPSATPPVRPPMFPNGSLWVMFIGAALAFSLRDFAGMSMGTVSSLFMQNANGFSPAMAGGTLSAIFLGATLSNPIFGGLSDRGRIRWVLIVLTIGAVLLALVPHVPAGALKPLFFTYGLFMFGSYPIVEAALMDAVPNAVRGRVFGLFITIGGLIGNLSHWLIGKWVAALGTEKISAAAYVPIYATLAALMLASLVGLPFLHALRRRENALTTNAAAANATAP